MHAAARPTDNFCFGEIKKVKTNRSNEERTGKHSM